jgi:hypothetical protein
VDWYIDTCPLINLYATGRLGEIITELGLRVHVTPRILRETKFVYGRHDLERGDEIPVNLEPLFSNDSLMVTSPLMDEENEEFLMLTTLIDDGEAEVMASAIARGGGVITDDGKVLKKMPALYPSLPMLTTITLIKRWALQVGLTSPQIREVLLDIQIGGNFDPPRSEPERAWWLEMFQTDD